LARRASNRQDGIPALLKKWLIHPNYKGLQ
jgi:hypothetical protein